ncbi:MAG: DNA-3-methyladenine glycosylase [Eubacteriales bacterium]
MKLGKDFYTRDTLTVAKDLLGKVLVFRDLKARITETESYIGRIDKAAHCYGNKMTKRTEVMFLEGGVVYVYLIYGMYYCMNIVTEIPGEGCAVLLRSVDPISNIDTMFVNRYGISREIANTYQVKNLTNGPGKLCKALGITKNENGVSLLGEKTYIEDDGFIPAKIRQSKRINIDYAQEAIDFPWRYYYDK